jgi:ABC-type nitrate/sulfonate/bicarbonate transport system permease component
VTILRKIAIGTIVPALVLAGYATWTGGEPVAFFPTPAAIADRFQELWLFGHLTSDLLPSLRNFVIGYAAAVVAGIAVGSAVGRLPLMRLLFAPLLDFGRSVPAIMLIPPLVLILGVGDTAKITIIATGAFFPIVLATIDGLARVDPALIDVTRSLQLSRWKELRVAWLPSAAPSIAGGMQTGLQFALILMVSSEMLAAVRGVGYLTMQAQLTFDSESVWSGIVLLALVGFALNALFVALRNRILVWHVAMRAASHAR